MGTRTITPIIHKQEDGTIKVEMREITSTISCESIEEKISYKYSFTIDELKLPEEEFIKIVDKKFSGLKELMLEQNNGYRNSFNKVGE